MYTLFRTARPKTIPCPAARPHIAQIREYPPREEGSGELLIKSFLTTLPYAGMFKFKIITAKNQMPVCILPILYKLICTKLLQSQGADNSQAKFRLKYMKLNQNVQFQTVPFFTFGIQHSDQIHSLLLSQCVLHKTKHPNKRWFFRCHLNSFM